MSKRLAGTIAKPVEGIDVHYSFQKKEELNYVAQPRKCNHLLTKKANTIFWTSLHDTVIYHSVGAGLRSVPEHCKRCGSFGF